jgi:hypothetical protein
MLVFFLSKKLFKYWSFFSTKKFSNFTELNFNSSIGIMHVRFICNVYDGVIILGIMGNNIKVWRWKVTGAGIKVLYHPRSNRISI